MSLLDVVSTLNTKHIAYADDLSCADKAQNLAIWWHEKNLGPKIGYFPKENKSWLVVKPDQYDKDRDIFKETTLHINKEG